MMIEPISNDSAQAAGAPRDLWDNALSDCRRDRKAFLDYMKTEWNRAEDLKIALTGRAPPTYFLLPVSTGGSIRLDIPYLKLQSWDEFGLSHLPEAQACRDAYLSWKARGDEVEDQIGWAAIEAELVRLAAISDASTDILMEMPAPDYEALAYKVLISHGDGREIEGWNDHMSADARRLTGCSEWPNEAL